MYCDKKTCRQPKLVICKECNLEKPHQGRGLCLSCRKKQRWRELHPSRMIKCVECKTEFPTSISKQKYCKTCHKTYYPRAYRKTPKYLERVRSTKFKQRANELSKKRRKENFTFRLNQNITNEINRSLKRQNIKKNRHWADIAGYSVNDLREHLWSLREPWITWENYGKGEGKWVIDHIKPKSKFKFKSIDDPEVKECWGLKNLRPLDWRENMIKNDKYLE